MEAVTHRNLQSESLPTGERQLSQCPDQRGAVREDGVETESELTHAAAQGDGETQTDNASKYLSRARNFRSSPNADFVHVG